MKEPISLSYIKKQLVGIRFNNELTEKSFLFIFCQMEGKNRVSNVKAIPGKAYFKQNT